MSECRNDGVLLAFLDGELKAADQQATAEHLAVCSHCAAALERVREMAGGVDSSLGALGVLPAASSKVIGRHRQYTSLILAAAAAVLALMVQVRHPQAVRQINTFLALDDDDPMEMQMGTVVRMKLPASLFDPTGTAQVSAMVESEVIVGEDGRPKAVRLLK